MSLRKYFLVIIFLVLLSMIFFEQKKKMTDQSETLHVLTLAPSVNRNAVRQRLKTEHFDVLIIGGGATGAGAALDAANRGFKVALVERFDFASGTSSKSTKLLHGGVRYLEKAIFNRDRQQYDLVLESLTERENLFQIAPHLTKKIEIVTPIYTWWEIPYYWIGLKVYDWIAGPTTLPGSGFLFPSQIAEKIPQIRMKKLTGGVVYYDGQFNDTRLNMALIKSAISLNAAVLNYAEAENLKYDLNGRINGAVIYDKIAEEKFEVSAKIVINAAGPYVDTIRSIDNPDALPLIMASSGTHIILDKKFTPTNTGLLIPKTKDGRVIFMLPWESGMLVGTTDNSTTLSDNPYPPKNDLPYLLSYVKEYFDITLKPSEIKSSWTGIRPLVQSPEIKNTANLARDHFIEKSPTGLITITGGKWTTFRKMAEDVVNLAAKQLGREENFPSTTQIRLIGYKGWSSALPNHLIEKFGIAKETADHLVSSYGAVAHNILEMGRLKSLNTLLAQGHPILLSEIQWALEEEMAQKPMDILVRRTRLGTLDARAAKAALPQVIDLMQKHLLWDETKTSQERDQALSELHHMTS